MPNPAGSPPSDTSHIPHSLLKKEFGGAAPDTPVDKKIPVFRGFLYGDGLPKPLDPPSLLKQQRDAAAFEQAALDEQKLRIQAMVKKYFWQKVEPGGLEQIITEAFEAGRALEAQARQ